MFLVASVELLLIGTWKIYTGSSRLCCCGHPEVVAYSQVLPQLTTSQRLVGISLTQAFTSQHYATLFIVKCYHNLQPFRGWL